MPEVLIFNIKGAVRIGLISFTSTANTSGSAPEEEESKQSELTAGQLDVSIEHALPRMQGLLTNTQVSDVFLKWTPSNLSLEEVKYFRVLREETETKENGEQKSIFLGAVNALSFVDMRAKISNEVEILYRVQAIAYSGKVLAESTTPFAATK